MQGSNHIFAILRMYNGTTWFLPLFLTALVYLWLKSERNIRNHMLITAAALFVFVLNDISLKVVSKVIGSDTYYRFLWMLPLMSVLSYVAVAVTVRQKTMVGKFAVAAGIACLLVFGGNFRMDRDSLKRPAHVEYINSEVKDMADAIEKDGLKEYPKVASPLQVALSIRLRNSRIVNYIMRNTYMKDGDIKRESGPGRRQYRAHKLVNGGQIKVSTLKNLIKYGHIDYFIIESRYKMDDLMSKGGCTILSRTANYTIYRC